MPKLHLLMDSLFFDQNGNIIAKLTDVNRNIHNSCPTSQTWPNKTNTEVLHIHSNP